MNNPATQGGNDQFVNFAGDLIQKVSKVHINVGQEFIVTTEDKIRLCMNKHLGILENKKSWTTPLGIFITICVIFPTTEFKQFIVKPETWQAIFILSGIISFVWLLKSIGQAWVSSSVDSVVNDIKKRSAEYDSDLVKDEKTI